MTPTADGEACNECESCVAFNFYRVLGGIGVGLASAICPMMAQEELTMFFYIFFATFLFLIPAALVGAELGSAFASKGGGVYTWVNETTVIVFIISAWGHYDDK